MRKCFGSGVNIFKTRRFPGADIGSDNDLGIVTFRVCLKKARKPTQPRLRFDLERFGDPHGACTFQAIIGGKLASLIGLRDDCMGLDIMITINNTAMTDTARAIHGEST